MLQVRTVLEKEEWNGFLNKSYSGSFPFFQTWNWGEVQRLLGNTTYHLGLFDNEKLLGIILIVEIKAKRGHYFYLRQGPVFTKFTKELFDFFLLDIKRLAKKNKASFIRISRFPKTEEINYAILKQKGFIKAAIQTIDAEVCFVLNLDPLLQDILKSMRKSHRYLIKKALTSGIEVIKSTKPQDMDLFLPLYKDLSKQKHFIPHKGLREEFELFGKDDESMLFLAKYEKKIIAGAMIDFVGNTAIYRHGSSDKNFNNIPASYLLQWEAIQEAKKRGMKLYNFWGIAPPESKNHPWKGITLFKTGFGGDYEYYFPTLDLPLSPAYIKNYAIDFISKLKKR